MIYMVCLGVRMHMHIVGYRVYICMCLFVHVYVFVPVCEGDAAFQEDVEII